MLRGVIIHQETRRSLGAFFIFEFISKGAYTDRMFSLQKTVLGTRVFDRRIYVFVMAIVGLFLFDGVAVYFTWYWKYQWLDIPVHFIAGLILSMLFYYLVFTNQVTAWWLKIKRNKRNTFTVMVFWVLVVAVGWEIFEFMWGRTHLSSKFAVDLFLDITVTCGGALVGYWTIKRYKL